MTIAILSAPESAPELVSGDSAVLFQISGLTKRRWPRRRATSPGKSCSRRRLGQVEDLAGVANVSFSVGPGEVLGLIGPNGAGKTTLLEAIVGLLPVDDGEIRWLGRLLTAADRRRHFFYVPDGVRPACLTSNPSNGSSMSSNGCGANSANAHITRRAGERVYRVIDVSIRSHLNQERQTAVRLAP
jgi:hypothetical protein